MREASHFLKEGLVAIRVRFFRWRSMSARCDKLLAKAVVLFIKAVLSKASNIFKIPEFSFYSTEFGYGGL